MRHSSSVLQLSLLLAILWIAVVSSAEEPRQDNDDELIRQQNTVSPTLAQPKSDEEIKDVLNRISDKADDKQKTPKLRSLLMSGARKVGSSILNNLSKLGAISKRILAQRWNRLRKIKIPTFGQFKKKFKKHYNGTVEESSRFLAYFKTVCDIMRQNSNYVRLKTHHYSNVNEDSDMSDEEFMRTKTVPIEMSDKPEEVPKYPSRMLEKLHQLSQRASFPYDKQLNVASDESINEEEPLDVSRHGHSNSKQIRRKKRGTDTNDPMDIDEDELSNDLDPELAAKIEPIAKQHIDFEPINLRHTGCVPRSEAQKDCGACYAFASTFGAQYHHCIEKKRTDVAVPADKVALSQRFTSDCGHIFSPHISGCAGGAVIYALQFLSRYGTVGFYRYEIERYRHLDDEGKYRQCFFDDGKTMPHELLKKMRETSNPQLITPEMFKGAEFYSLSQDYWYDHLRYIGPVYVNIVMPDWFKNYAGDVVDEKSLEGERHGVHTMLLVGKEKYLDIDGIEKPCWVFLNSFGTLWGSQGYVRLSQEATDRLVSLAFGVLPKEMQEDEELVENFRIYPWRNNETPPPTERPIEHPTGSLSIDLTDRLPEKD